MNNIGPRPAGPVQDDPQIRSSLRRLAFYCVVGLVFLHYTRLHEVLSFYTGANTRILYFFSVPALAGFFITGALGRAFSGRPTIYWTAFVVWMVIATPFSTWKGASVQTVLSFTRADYVMLPLLAGLPMTWKECRTLAYTIGAAGIVNVAIAAIFVRDYGTGRFGTEFATLGNPNDYAGQLLMVLPMTAYLVLYAHRMKIIVRLMGIAAIAYGLYTVFASGSRGAVLGLAVAWIFMVVKANARQRIFMIVGLTFASVVGLVLIPRTTLARLQNYSTEFDLNSEAQQSAFIRQNLLKDSVKATLTHPLFGVGPGEFGDYEGLEKIKTKEVGMGYVNAHNSYTQISADNGIPGFLFYIAGTISAFMMLQRILKKARLAGRDDIANACFCLSVGCIGFCVAIFFLNFAYFPYLPAFAGIAVSLYASTERELEQPKPARTSTLASPIVAKAAPEPPADPRNRFRFGRYR